MNEHGLRAQPPPSQCVRGDVYPRSARGVGAALALPPVPLARTCPAMRLGTKPAGRRAPGEVRSALLPATPRQRRQRRQRAAGGEAAGRAASRTWDHLRDQAANRAEISPHPAPPGSSGQLGWTGGGPGGPTWSQGHLVRWRASPTGASASSFASSPHKWLAPGR
jgi:hypothetical protein